MTTQTSTLSPFEQRCLHAATPPSTPAPPTFADQLWRALTAATGLTQADVDAFTEGETDLHVYTGTTRLRLMWPNPAFHWWWMKAERICPECGAVRFAQQVGAANTEPAGVLARIGAWLAAQPEARCARHGEAS